MAQEEQYTHAQKQEVGWAYDDEEEIYLEVDSTKAQAEAECESEADVQDEAIEKIKDLLAYHVGTPLDSYGTSKKPQPEWCNNRNCEKYRDECETCIAIQIHELYKSLGYLQLDDDQSLPGVADVQDDIIVKMLKLTQEDMLKNNFRRFKE